MILPFFFVLITLVSLGSYNAYAQNVTQIITDTTKDIDECSLLKQAESLGLTEDPQVGHLFNATAESNTCVELIYESPNRILLTGDLITSGGVYNPGLWKTVGALESAGWNTDNEFLTGAGNKANPHGFVVIMTK